jgi:hypothetical protein
MVAVESLTFDKIQPGKTYTVGQVADLFSSNPASIYRLIATGKIKTVGNGTFGKKLILGQTVLEIANLGVEVPQSETPTERKRRAEAAAVEMARDHGVKLPDAIKHKQPKPSRRKK